MNTTIPIDNGAGPVSPVPGNRINGCDGSCLWEARGGRGCRKLIATDEKEPNPPMDLIVRLNQQTGADSGFCDVFGLSPMMAVPATD